MTGQPIPNSNADPPDGWSLPAWTYSDPEFFELEKERVFGPSWQIVCHASDLAAPGAWHTLDYIDEKNNTLRLKRSVAIKVLSSNWLTDESMVARFQNEARTIASLK